MLMKSSKVALASALIAIASEEVTGLKLKGWYEDPSPSQMKIHQLEELTGDSSYDRWARVVRRTPEEYQGMLSPLTQTLAQQQQIKNIYDFCRKMRWSKLKCNQSREMYETIRAIDDENDNARLKAMQEISRQKKQSFYELERAAADSYRELERAVEPKSNPWNPKPQHANIEIVRKLYNEAMERMEVVRIGGRLGNLVEETKRLLADAEAEEAERIRREEAEQKRLEAEA